MVFSPSNNSHEVGHQTRLSPVQKYGVWWVVLVRNMLVDRKRDQLKTNVELLTVSW